MGDCNLDLNWFCCRLYLLVAAVAIGLLYDTDLAFTY